MARKPNKPTGEIKLDLGELYPKQWQFIESKTRYTAYGGARGGGKTHVLIRAVIKGALEYLKRAVYDADAQTATADEIAESAIMGMVAAGVIQAGIELPQAISMRNVAKSEMKNQATAGTEARQDWPGADSEQVPQEAASEPSWEKYIGAPRADGTNPFAQARAAARQAAENADFTSMNTAERESFLQAYDMGRSGEGSEVDVSALPVQSDAVYGAFFQGQDDYFSGNTDRYAAYHTAESSRTEGPVVDTQKGTQPVDLPVAGQKNTASTGETGIHRMTMEDFTEVNSPVWNNVEYGDTETQSQITRQTHQAMVEEGAVVTVPEGTMEQVGQSYPDLRGMKKAERTPILRQKMKELKASLRQFLNGLKGGTYEFEVNGNILEAKLYDTGVREVLEKIDQSKASMLYHSDQVFQNARYLYSTPDYDGNPNVYRWNYFYTPVQIGDEIVGVRIAVRDMAKTQESQIYNWNIKTGAALDGGGGGNAASHTNVSSATPVESSISQSRSVVNGTSSTIWQKNEGASNADPQTRSGAATLPVPPETAPTDLPVVDQAAPSTPSKKKGIQIPIDERTWQDAGNRKVNAFQYDNPELHPYFVEAAPKEFDSRSSFQSTVDAVLLRGFGSNRTKKTYTSDQITSAVMEDGKEVILQDNKMKIVRRRVSGEWRMEITGQNLWYLPRQVKGVISEKIGSQFRYFIPTGDNGKPVLEDIVKINPVVDVRASVRADDVDSMMDASKATGDREEQWTSERVGSQDKEPMSLSDIIRKIEYEFGINVTIGHIRGSTTRGQYNRADKGIRTKIANDLPSVAHEVGHHFDDIYSLTKRLNNSLRKELVGNLGADMKKAYPERKWVKEGMAEFMRRFLQNRETAAID